MVVSKKEMLFILWKLSEVRTRHMHGNVGVRGWWDVPGARGFGS